MNERVHSFRGGCLRTQHSLTSTWPRLVYSTLRTRLNCPRNAFALAMHRQLITCEHKYSSHLVMVFSSEPFRGDMNEMTEGGGEHLDLPRDNLQGRGINEALLHIAS